MGVATRYRVEDLKPLVLSLRRHYTDPFVLFMYNPENDMREFMRSNDVQLVDMPYDISNGVEICNYRHKIYKEFLENNYPTINHVLITDTRDVVFQDDPFNHEITTELEFFLESEKYINCNCNGQWWIGGIYGNEVLSKMANEYIACAGTTIGTRSGILFYLDSIISEIDRMINLRGEYSQQSNPVVDQPCHGYLIYNDHFPNHKKYLSGFGPVATMNFHKNMNFNDGNLMNEDGSLVSLVHQWDRTGQYKEIFYRKAIGDL